MEITVQVTDEQRIALEQINDAIWSVIQCSGYPLTVKYGSRVVIKKGVEAFLINDNANFSLVGSYDIKNKVVEVLKRADLESIIPDYAIIVKLVFEQKSESNEQTTTEKVQAMEKASAATARKSEEVQQFFPVDPKYSFEQIIISDELRKDIYDSIKLIECKGLIYDLWGYGEIEPVAKSILNMHGPAGTGKTMCAHAIAKKLGKKLLALNYSEIESKYLGDSAKNLKRAFETAEKTDSVMFFDEADSFLGKRVENIGSSTDQALNSLRSQMLILLEEHNGVVLFATNLVSNFDPAFNSRIQKHIKFELPNKEARIEIIKKQIPKNLPHKEPFTDEKLAEASELADGFNGREIKNAMLNMYLSKADLNNTTEIDFTVEDICNAMKAKKDEKEKLEAERKEKLKQKIINKLSDKAEEERMTKEYEEQKNTANTDVSEPEVNEEK